MYVGVDIGGSKTLVAVLNDNGVIVERNKFPTPKKYEDFSRELALCVDNFTTKDFRAGAVGVPGRVDRERGIGLTFGNLDWQKVPILHTAEKIFNCPLAIENDANLAGLSEAKLIPAYRRVLYVTISTGIGTGIINDQAIDPLMADSEPGHMRLQHHNKLAEWEDFASGKAIVRRFGKKAADINDSKTWRLIAHDISLGLLGLIAIVQPEVIVIGGSVGTHFLKYHKWLEAELKKYETPMTPMPILMQARRPEEAVVYGCYDLAKALYGTGH